MCAVMYRSVVAGAGSMWVVEESQHVRGMNPSATRGKILPNFIAMCEKKNFMIEF